MEKLVQFFDEVSDVACNFAKWDGVIPDLGVVIPPVLEAEARQALLRAAQSDENCPTDVEPFASWGKWHRAANILQSNMNEFCKNSKGHGIPFGDWSWNMLMRLARKELSYSPFNRHLAASAIVSWEVVVELLHKSKNAAVMTNGALPQPWAEFDATLVSGNSFFVSQVGSGESASQNGFVQLFAALSGNRYHISLTGIAVSQNIHGFYFEV